LDRFRWIFCQLEALRHCLPPSVRCTLRELPETLDETYERILKEIKKPNRGHARRVLQCLVVAIRPLRVAELAEVLAVDFDDDEGVTKLKPDWRWEDQEQALLIACSSLISIVETGDSRVVQFSHFSVKEYLTSTRLTAASGEASNFHIDLKPAHRTLAEACLCVLLQTHDGVEANTPSDHPLVQYAARHWTNHTQFVDMSRLQKGMEYLFDPDKPHFEMWRTLCDIDTLPDKATFSLLAYYRESTAAPLYYAALCGFHDLVEYLIIKYPQYVNANGGYCVTPLLAALAGKHFQTADLLRHNGADPHFRGREMRTPLHSAACYGNLEVVQKLIEYGADISAEDLDGCTPLHLASEGHSPKNGFIVRLLLDLGADVNARAKNGLTPLHKASTFRALELARVLLGHGADVNARDADGRTPLYSRLYWIVTGSAIQPRAGSVEVARLLLERGADVNARTNDGSTPLHAASSRVELAAVRLLLEHGADVEAEDDSGRTPFQVAGERCVGDTGDEVIELLLEYKAE
jgi:ankyrin repeat protein